MSSASFLLYPPISTSPAKSFYSNPTFTRRIQLHFSLQRRSTSRNHASRNTGNKFNETLMDRHAFECTLNHMSKWVATASICGMAILRHDGEAIWFMTGPTVNAMLSLGLKRVFNQDRPDPAIRSDPGMPSSHAQNIMFIAVFTVLSIVEWNGINEISLTIGLLVLGFATYLSWLRVSQKLHTWSQVVVGALCGSIVSILWCFSWHSIVNEAFDSSLWIRSFLALGLVDGF